MSLVLAEKIFEACLVFTKFDFLLKDHILEGDSGKEKEKNSGDSLEIQIPSSVYEDEKRLRSLFKAIHNAVCPLEVLNFDSIYVFQRLQDQSPAPRTPASPVSPLSLDFSSSATLSRPPSHASSSASAQNWLLKPRRVFRFNLDLVKTSLSSEMSPQAEILTLDKSKTPKKMPRFGSFRISSKEDTEKMTNIRRVKSFALAEKISEPKMKKRSSFRRQSSKILSKMFRKRPQNVEEVKKSNGMVGIQKTESFKSDRNGLGKREMEKKVTSSKSLKTDMDLSERPPRTPNDTESMKSVDSSICSVTLGTGSSTSASELDQELDSEKLQVPHSAPPTSDEIRFTLRSPSPDLSIGGAVCQPKLHKIGEKLKNLLSTNDQHHFAQFRRLFHGLVPEGDDLIMSFGCTYQTKDTPIHIPSQGRLYLTLTSLGFNCSLFGAEKKFVISLKNVTNVERDKPNRLFSSGIKVQTDAETYCFNSLKSRDKAFTLIYRVWQMYVPSEKLDVKDENSNLISELSPRPMPEVGLPDSEYPISGDTASTSSGSGSTSSSVHISDNDEPSTCPCIEHKGRQLLDEEYPLSVEQMYILLFTDNPWLKNFSENVRRSEMVTGTWRNGLEPGMRVRENSYRMELTQSFGPKYTNINETQTCTEIGSSGEGYVITKEACNSGIPYADHFSVNCTYCLTRVSAHSCRLRVHGGMVYKKSIFMGIKGIIERSTTNGLEEYYKALHAALMSESDNLSQMIREAENNLETENFEDESRTATLTHSNNAQPYLVNEFSSSRRQTLERPILPLPSQVTSTQALPQLDLLQSINTSLRIIAFLLFVMVLVLIFSSFVRTPSTMDVKKLQCESNTVQESLVELIRHKSVGEIAEIKSLLETINKKLARSQ